MGGIRIGKYQILPGAYIWIGIAAVVAVFSVVVYRNAQQARVDDELRESAKMIMLAVEVFAVNGEDGEYPESFEQVVKDGIIEAGYDNFIEIPDNPYGPGKMKLLQPEDPAEPGGFVYFHDKPITYYYYRNDFPSTIVTYHLYFYGPHGRRDKWYTQVPFGVDAQYIVFRLHGTIG